MRQCQNCLCWIPRDTTPEQRVHGEDDTRQYGACCALPPIVAADRAVRVLTPCDEGCIRYWVPRD